MSIRPIPLADATPEQKRAYVTDFLNLEASPSDSDDTIASKIAAAQPGVTMIFVQEADTEAEQLATETVGEVPLKPEESTGRMSGTLGHGDPRAVIVIPSVETTDNSGSRDVVVGVNGRAWLLKRDVQLPIPWRVVVALQNAVANVVTHRTDEGHEGEVQERLSSRAPFHFIEKPTDAEIAEWHERTDALFCA